MSGGSGVGGYSKHGSGSGMGSGSSRGGKSGKTPCEELKIDTVLSSPNPNIISHLKVNNILIVELQNNLLLAITNNGEVAGSIISQDTARIKACIEEGFEYVAVVMKINGGRCDIHIKLAD